MKMKLSRSLVTVFAVLLAHSSAFAQDGATKVLRFSAIPDQNSTELKAKYDPLAAHLGKVLGVQVEYVPARDYQAAVELFKNGDTQLAWFGGLTGVQARTAVPGSMAIAQGDEDPEYYSYFIAHKSTKLARAEVFPKEIADMSFTFGSRSSTSGRLMPEYFIQQASGKLADKFFKKPTGFSDSHDKTAELVCSGQYSVGVLSYQVYNKLVSEGKIKAEDCPIIWQTPSYADYNWTAHPVLDKTYGAGFTEKIKKALLEIRDPSLLSPMLRSKMIEAKNEDFAQIEAVAKQLNMLR